jgi:hypothetical protein
MNSRIDYNRRNDGFISSDEDESDENELSPDLFAQLENLLDGNNRRLHNILVARGYTRDQDRNVIGEEMDEEDDDDSEWNPSEDEGSQDGDENGDNNINFHMHDDSNEKLHDEVFLEVGKRWIPPRDGPVINIAKPCDCN